MRYATRVACPGEAHSNAHIDNCSICMPSWGHYWQCPTCQAKIYSDARCTNRDCPSWPWERFILA